MRIFLAGDTGAIGKRLTGLLLARGHEVVAMTRSAGAESALRGKPEVVVHELTRLGEVEAV